jgi:hypothetical protein
MRARHRPRAPAFPPPLATVPRRLLTPAVAALVALPAACGGGAPAAEGPTMRVDTVAGVAHVHHTGRAPTVSLARTLSLGEAAALEEESPAEFGLIRTVVADADGRLYIADAHALEVRVFEADGRFLRALGRKGSGPGETEGFHGAVWLSPDTLVILDYGNARLGLLDPEGRYLGQWPWIALTGPTRFHFAVAPGELYTQGLRRGEDDAGRPLLDAVWVRHGRAGPADSLAIPRLDSPLSGTAVICRGAQGIGFFSNPFGERLLAVPAPAGERIVALSSTYRLAFLDAAGDTVRTLTREAEPVPLDDDAWRETEEEYAAFRRSWRGVACDGEIRRPRHLPILREISFDHQGRLLVELATPEGPTLDLYDHDWRWLATIPLPERDGRVPLHLQGDRLYLVTRDTLGVQRVEAFRLPLDRRRTG